MSAPAHGGRIADRRSRPQIRLVEEAALAILVERLPEPTTESRLVLEMMAEVIYTPERVAEIRLAAEGLIAVGLLIRVGDVLRPTPAAARAAELELGLP